MTTWRNSNMVSISLPPGQIKHSSHPEVAGERPARTSMESTLRTTLFHGLTPGSNDNRTLAKSIGPIRDNPHARGFRLPEQSLVKIGKVTTCVNNIKSLFRKKKLSCRFRIFIPSRTNQRVSRVALAVPLQFFSMAREWRQFASAPKGSD